MVEVGGVIRVSVDGHFQLWTLSDRAQIQETDENWLPPFNGNCASTYFLP